MAKQICNDCGGTLNLLGRCHCPIPKHGTSVKKENVHGTAKDGR